MQSQDEADGIRNVWVGNLEQVGSGGLACYTLCPAGVLCCLSRFVPRRHYKGNRHTQLCYVPRAVLLEPRAR